MSLASYAEYKDSGVAWLGEVPEHWLVTPVKRLGKLKGGAGFPYVEQGHETEELPFHKVNALGRADSDGVLWGSENNISLATAKRLGAFVFPAHALVFAKVGAALLLGRIRTLGEAACIDNNMMGLVVDSDDADVAFVSYALNLVRFDLIANPGAVPSLNEGQIGNFPLVLPSRTEQSAIAAFLDRETGKIDALIAEQEKLLTLLAEKRQATISHAVTRGLTNLPGADLNAAFGCGPKGEGKDGPSHPNAPMKDSGVPWLGEVPAHWEVRRLKTLSVFTTSGPRGWSERITEGGNLFIQSGDLDDNLEVDFLNAKRVSVDEDAEAARTRLADGDVVICITGAKTGNVALCGIIPEPAFVNQHLCLVRPNAEVHSRYLGLALKSRFGQVQLDLSQYGLKQGLSLENIRDLLIVLPPHDEQLAIAAHLDAEAAKSDRLTDDAKHAIALLKERRSALIAAAVTGKIDVRNLAKIAE